MASSTQDSLDIRDYLAVPKAQKWSIIIVTALVAAAAIGFSYMQTPLYSAEARVFVTPQTTPQGFTAAPQPVDVDTESQLVESEQVASKVRGDLNLDLPLQSLLGGLSVAGASQNQTFYTTSQVLILTYTSPDPRVAQEVVNEFADEYIAFRRRQGQKSFLRVQASLQRKADAVTEQLDRVTEDIAKATTSGDSSLISTLETERSTLLGRLGVIQQRSDDLEPIQTALTASGQVIKTATLPGAPSSPNLLVNTVLGVLAGLVLGVALAFLRERLDNRFRERGDVEEALQAPVLATIPKYSLKTKKAFSEIVAATRPKSHASEAYRTLRTNLQFACLERNVKSLLVASPSAGEGKTSTVANLGVTMAQTGRRVILVSSDMRIPTLERYFDVPHTPGLSDLLDDGLSEIANVVRRSGHPNLRVIPAGPLPTNPAELLASRALPQLVRILEENCDVVIFDSPPILAVADASILASAIGSAVLVIDATSTQRSAAMHAREELERAGAQLIGTALNSFDPSGSSYYSGSYYYDAGSELTAHAASEGNGSAEPARRNAVS
jgi:capsular exopolysaccharide synthesis family protein